jgi:hypothetical protein
MVITGKVKTLFAMRSPAGRTSGLWLTQNFLLAENDPLTGGATEKELNKNSLYLTGN